MKKTIFILIIFCIIFGNLNAAERRRFEKPSLEYDPNATPHSNHGSSTDELFDLQFCFPVAVGNGEAGIECDGNYFYTTKMNGNAFYKYELDGTYIGEFTVDGCPGSIRELTYDGQYFYGAAATNTVYEMDFDTQTVISTITASIVVRGIAYDGANDGFWGNNWSDQITLFDRSGATLNSFPCGTLLNNYGIAWENTLPGGPYLWFYCSDDSTQNQLVQIDIATGFETGVNFDVSIATPLTGIPGGLYITDQIILGEWTIGGLCQNDVIWGLELGYTTLNELIPISTELIGNYPNPFNPETIISYQLQENSTVELTIYNLKGQKIKTLCNEKLPAGEHSVMWNGRDSNDKRVSSGIYFYKLKAGDHQKVKKMLLMK